MIPMVLAVMPLCAAPLPAQEQVAVEATTLVVDETRMRRLGLTGAVVSAPDRGAATGRAEGNVVVSGRVGGVEAAAWLDLVRGGRAVQRESTQRVLVLSGHPAQVSSQQTVFDRYGAVSAGPAVWVEPVALPDGMVRLRIWSTDGAVQSDRYGTVHQEVRIEGSTEVVVRSGTSVVIASADLMERSNERGMLTRRDASKSGQAWIVVTARIVENPADAFPIPAGLRERQFRDGP
jgi:hypothetical protein